MLHAYIHTYVRTYIHMHILYVECSVPLLSWLVARTHHTHTHTTLTITLILSPADVDYDAFSATVTFKPDDTVMCVINVTTIDDSEGEPSEVFEVCVTAITTGVEVGTTERAVVLIEDDDRKPTPTHTKRTLQCLNSVTTSFLSCYIMPTFLPFPHYGMHCHTVRTYITNYFLYTNYFASVPMM